MKELVDIVALAGTAAVPQAALATVVRIEGSSYRRPGAALLVGPDGRRLGSVSGGCLERDVESHGRTVLATGEPRLVTYDTRGDADMVFGTALGCGGLVEVFIERVDLRDPQGPVARWAAAAAQRDTLGELVIVAAPEGAPVTAGERMWLTPEEHTQAQAPRLAADRSEPRGQGAQSVSRSMDATASAARARGGTAADDARRAALVRELLEAARPAFDARRSTLVSHQTGEGEVRAFLRAIEPPVQLIVCGAGDDAQPLVRMGVGLGWQVCVLDHRAAFAVAGRFPEASRVEVTMAGTLPADVRVDGRTAAVVMNHHFPSDGAWLRALAALPLTYLGLLGARHRTARLLREAGLPSAGPDGLAQLFAPAGLNIGAEGPEAIALAMLAEIQAVLAGRAGGLLRDSSAPVQTSIGGAVLSS